MTLPKQQCLDAIERHTRGLAHVASEHLDARIEHCPDWSMADLVQHLTGVHRFWEHVARERPSEAPDLPELARPEDDQLIPAMLAAMERLIATLATADPAAPCWTWGLEQNVGFVLRHQVQEAAVHHWDAINAIGGDRPWDPLEEEAIDAVDEFLTESVGNARWPKEGGEPIGGTIRLGGRWRITDGDQPGTVRVTDESGSSDEAPGILIGADVEPARVLLWLYGRIPDEGFDSTTSTTDRELLGRFRALTYTD